MRVEGVVSRPLPYKKLQDFSRIAKALRLLTGADLRTRTADPILTMDVLYLLS